MRLGIKGKKIPMNFPLLMYGETNKLPVSTTIDAMRGHGRIHTTRKYPIQRYYGFNEGDFAVAHDKNTGRDVVFKVGKEYQITPEMVADPEYQAQWADMEKHSAKVLSNYFPRGAYGMYYEPVGDLVDGRVLDWDGNEINLDTWEVKTAPTQAESDLINTHIVEQPVVTEPVVREPIVAQRPSSPLKEEVVQVVESKPSVKEEKFTDTHYNKGEAPEWVDPVLLGGGGLVTAAGLAMLYNAHLKNQQNY